MNSGQKSILVVDDEELNLDMLSRRLTRTGFKVQVARSGREALTLISQCEFALVLLDHMMPEMSGREVLSELRKIYTTVALQSSWLPLSLRATRSWKRLKRAQTTM